MLPINIANLYSIPEEMRQFNSWVLWKSVRKDGKLDKVLFQPHSKPAKVNEPSTWNSFGDVVGTLQACPHVYSGAGFVFSERDPYAGIDLDNVAKKLAEMADRAKAAGRPIDEAELADKQAKWGEQQELIYKQFNCYTEWSPSETGLHTIITVTDKKKIWDGRRRNAVELYCQGRFFTMTGNVYLPAPIEERQGLAEILWAQLGGAKNNQSTYAGDPDEKHTDGEVIRWALNAANGEKFSALLNGDWENIYPSQSEADFAFCNIVAYYTDCQKQVIRIFRNSALGKREKAKRDDYVLPMVRRAFDRKLPPIDLEFTRLKLEEFLKGRAK